MSASVQTVGSRPLRDGVRLARGLR